jgi:hypothetical protein
VDFKLYDRLQADVVAMTGWVPMNSTGLRWYKELLMWHYLEHGNRIGVLGGWRARTRYTVWCMQHALCV